MKAIVQTAYGSPDVFELREIEKPVVDDDGVLIRVRAASVNALDWHLMRGTPLWSRFVSQRLVLCITRLKQEDLIVMRDLMEAGKVTPVIDTCYRLSEASRAIRHLAEGHARGKIFVTVEPDNTR